MATGCSDDDRRISTELRPKITKRKDERTVFPETKPLDKGQSFFRMFPIPRQHFAQQEEEQKEEQKEDKILPPLLSRRFRQLLRNIRVIYVGLFLEARAAEQDIEKHA